MLTQTAIRASAPPTYFAAPPVDRVVNSRPPRDLLATILHLIGAVVSYRRNTELFGENEPADYLYKVVSGGVRTIPSRITKTFSPLPSATKPSAPKLSNS